MLFGDKNKFGIEISKKEASFIGARLWLENNYIGCLNDEILPGTFLICLKGLTSEGKFPKPDDLLRMMRPSEMMEFVNSSSDNKFDASLLSFPDSFDDFTARIFNVGDSLLITWKLVSNPYFEYSDLSLHKTYQAKVKMDDIRAVYYEVSQFLSPPHPLKK